MEQIASNATLEQNNACNAHRVHNCNPMAHVNVNQIITSTIYWNHAMSVMSRAKHVMDRTIAQHVLKVFCLVRQSVSNVQVMNTWMGTNAKVVGKAVYHVMARSVKNVS